MASIITGYFKTGGMLILDPREKLVYPFNIGDYSEVRFGMYISFTSGAEFGDNTNIFTDRGTASSSALSKVYIGFCNFNTGTLFPGQSGGYDFVGTISDVGASDVGLTDNNDNNYVVFRPSALNGTNNWSTYTTDLTGNLSYKSDFNIGGGPLYIAKHATGASNYASLVGAQFYYSGSNAFVYRVFGNSTTMTTDTRLSVLRTDISNLGTVRTNFMTGFFTSGGINSSNLLMKPNSLFIYTPMLNSRLRIHALLVERYA